jgi:uncharacterized membrane-anchored protein
MRGFTPHFLERESTMSDTKKFLLRVPEVTLIFWIIKILSTTVGETAADFLSTGLGFGMPLVALIIGSIMAFLLFLQFSKIKRYEPVNYWSIVVLMSIVGTLITDILVDKMGISDLTLSIVFTITMIAGFLVWHKQEKTLSIHSIDTAKREAYYWIIILLAFALGTAFGDLISEQILSAGYGIALMLFAGLIAFVAVGYYVFKLDSVWAFWLAFVLTRPLGASLGDFMIQSFSNGGLGINITYVNILFFAIIVYLVVYLQFKQNNISIGYTQIGKPEYVSVKIKNKL